MSNQAGELLRWWIGTVEDVEDPKELGRVKVRILNFHTEDWTTEDLPWASILAPTSSASVKGVGISPVGLLKGSTVIGFFVDGDEQFPKIMGTWHFAPDEANHAVPPLARGRQVLRKQKTADIEPDSAFAAKYPYNLVYQSQSGHAVEIDDTPGEERIHVYHKSGSYVEIDKDGRMVIKASGDSFDITGGTKNIFVKGDCNIQTDGRFNATAKGDMTLVTEGNLNLGALKRTIISGTTGMELRSGFEITTQSPGGLTVAQGSITSFGKVTSGTGVTGSVVAGGTWFEFRDGILTGMGGG